MTRKRKPRAKTAPRRRQTKRKNPALKTRAPAGWIPATAVRIKRNRGKIEVYIRRKARRAAVKRKRAPAKRKSASRRKR